MLIRSIPKIKTGDELEEVAESEAEKEKLRNAEKYKIKDISELGGLL